MIYKIPKIHMNFPMPLMPFALAIIGLLAGLFHLQNRYLAEGVANARDRHASFGRQLSNAREKAVWTQSPESLAFPKFEMLAHVIKDAQQLLKDVGVQVERVNQIPLAQAPEGGVNQVEISFRLKGDYPAVKKFMARLLAQHTELALKSLSIERDQALDMSQKVEARFVLYYQK